MCQFQYQIGHCEIAMDTSMTNPLSARITNKGRNWFARTPWLRRISLNSLRFSCSPAVGAPHFLFEDLAQHPPERSLGIPTSPGTKLGGGSTRGLANPQARTVGASFDDRSNSRPHHTGTGPPRTGPARRSSASVHAICAEPTVKLALKLWRTANDDVRFFRRREDVRCSLCYLSPIQ